MRVLGTVAKALDRLGECYARPICFPLAVVYRQGGFLPELAANSTVIDAIRESAAEQCDKDSSKHESRSFKKAASAFSSSRRAEDRTN